MPDVKLQIKGSLRLSVNAGIGNRGTEWKEWWECGESEWECRESGWECKESWWEWWECKEWVRECGE